MKTINFEIPKGYEIDIKLSTKDKIVLSYKNDYDWKDITSYEKACEVLNETALFSNNDTPDEIAYKKLKIVIKAINQGWYPDWNNSNQYKYYPYFNLSSGFGFSVAGYHCGYSVASVGSRLCFETREKAVYAGNQFLQLYKEFYT